MQRVAFRMKLLNGYADEYKRRHDLLWPELKELLKQTGISDYSIFLDEGTGVLYGTLKINETTRLDDLSKHSVMKKWWAYMKDIMETTEDDSPVTIPLKEVFYLP